MNGLNLRICSENKSKLLKKEVIPEDILQFVPENFSLNSDNTPFEKLLKASSIDEQLKAVKEVINYYFCIQNDQNAQKIVLECLISIFWGLKAKSLLKQPVLKLLNTLPNDYTVLVQDVMIYQLKSKTGISLSIEEIYNLSYSILLCLESPYFHVSFETILIDLVSFTKSSLEICFKEYQLEEIHIVKLDIINALHSTVRLGIAIFQKNSTNVTEELIFVSKMVLSDLDLPLDTRSAAGLLTALLSHHFSPKYCLKLLHQVILSKNELSLIFYCSGLVNILSSDELENHIEDEKPLIQVIYQSLMETEQNNASNSEIVLSVARSMLIVTRSLINVSATIISDIIDSLLLYLWNHLDHYLDAVRHLAHSSLLNVQSIALTHPDLCIFDKIFNDLTDMSIDKRCLHSAISILVPHIKVSSIIYKLPGLVNSLFSAALSNPPSNHAIHSLNSLITQDFIENSEQNAWFELWVQPLFKNNLSPSLESLLTTVLTVNPLIINYIIDIQYEDVNTAVFLTCLKIAKKIKILPNFTDPNKWFGIVDYNFLENCMFNLDDNIRISCFSLIIENSKITEEFTVQELILVKTFLEYNFTCQDPAFRQKSLSYCKKFLTRLKDSQGALLRRQVKQARSENSNENISLILNSYSNIVKDIREMCLESLFPGASPPRRSFSLGLLSIYQTLGFWNNFDKDYTTIVPTLLSTLLDSFEENKLIAKKLLTCLPKNHLNFDKEDFVQSYMEEALKLSCSIRPPDSLSSAYFIDLLASFDDIGDRLDVVCNSRFYCFNETLKVLKRDLNRAQEESVMVAASSGPLYGQIFVLRHLFEEINDDEMKQMSSCSEWRSLIKKVIQIAFECNHIVSDVVYNSSPEGHLPNDFTSSSEDSLVTSQMLLLCSWRTVKEVSLLLGVLVERAPIISGDNTGLLDETQILSIGEHLTQLLSKTKHRGAFEQAYLGFSKLTSRLWKCKQGQLNGLTEKWLDDTLFCIVNDNLSATRRSAGIPFIIQALVYSELEIGSCRSLHKVMRYLLDLSESCEFVEGRVHSLNILRALYRGSSLGEVIGPYVGEGLIRAMSGFNAADWGERNSATLLFSALISRVFGVPRGKSEVLHWRNRMTGRLFFQRYPVLYEELLKHLETTSLSPLYPALYPVLLLLARIYPSSLEGTDSNLQLLKYLPLVTKCAESSVLKTRYLAASAVSSLISLESHFDYISQFLNLLKNKNHTENTSHGLLLMVLKLVQESPSIDNSKYEDFVRTLNSWIDILVQFSCSKHSFISKDTSIQIILQLLLKYHEYFEVLKIQFILNNLKEELFIMTTNHYGSEIFNLHLFLLHILLNFQLKSPQNILKLIITLLRLNSYEIIGTILELLNFILLKKSNIFIPEFHESLKVTFNDETTRLQLVKEILSCEELQLILAERFSSELHQEDFSKLLKVLKYFPSVFNSNTESCITLRKLNEIIQNSTPAVSCPAIECMNSYLSASKTCGFPEDIFEIISGVICEYSEPNSDFDCRRAVAELISEHFVCLTQNSSPLVKLDIWISIVRLILDEENEIRQTMSSKLTSRLVPSKSLQLIIEQFMTNNDSYIIIPALLYWAVGDNVTNTLDETDCVFDKGVDNAYFENIILNRIACSHLQNLNDSNKDLVNLKFDNLISNWLFNKSNIEGDSLIGFLRNYKNSILTCEKFQKCLPCSSQTHIHSCLLRSQLLRNLESIFSLC